MPIDWAMPCGAAHSVLVNTPTPIAHIAKSTPAISPGRTQFSTVLVPDCCDIFQCPPLPKTGNVADAVKAPNSYTLRCAPGHIGSFWFRVTSGHDTSRTDPHPNVWNRS